MGFWRKLTSFRYFAMQKLLSSSSPIEESCTSFAVALGKNKLLHYCVYQYIYLSISIPKSTKLSVVLVLVSITSTKTWKTITKSGKFPFPLSLSLGFYVFLVSQKLNAYLKQQKEKFLSFALVVFLLMMNLIYPIYISMIVSVFFFLNFVLVVLLDLKWETIERRLHN